MDAEWTGVRVFCLSSSHAHWIRPSGKRTFSDQRFSSKHYSEALEMLRISEAGGWREVKAIWGADVSDGAGEDIWKSAWGLLHSDSWPELSKSLTELCTYTLVCLCFQNVITMEPCVAGTSWALTGMLSVCLARKHSRAEHDWWHRLELCKEALHQGPSAGHRVLDSSLHIKPVSPHRLLMASAVRIEKCRKSVQWELLYASTREILGHFLPTQNSKGP